MTAHERDNEIQIDNDAAINRIAKSFARSEYEDDGMFLDAVHEAVREAAQARGVTGAFDDETLTWTSDRAVVL